MSAIASQLGVLAIMLGGFAIIIGYRRAAIRILLIAAVLIIASAVTGSHPQNTEQNHVLG